MGKSSSLQRAGSLPAPDRVTGYANRQANGGVVRRCDPDGVIEDALLGSGKGRVYQMIREFEAEMNET